MRLPRMFSSRGIVAQALSVSAIIFGIGLAPTVSADEPDAGLPAQNDPFWSFIGALDRPDDADCLSIAQGALYSIPADNATNFCAQLAQMPTQMRSGMNQTGESMESNLFDASDWHNVQNLYFQHSTSGVADGRIAFTRPVDFMSYAFMNFMMTFGQRMESSPGILGLDADIVGGMRNYGAVLTMYNVPDVENPMILVDGQEDTGGVVSNIIYDRTAHTLTFDAAHFTTFEVIESGTLPSIDEVKATRYVTWKGKRMLRVVVDGNNFQKNAVVKLGNREATSMTWKNNGRRLVAHFPMADLERVGRKRLTVKVVNSNGLEDTYKEKLNFYRLLGKFF